MCTLFDFEERVNLVAALDEYADVDYDIYLGINIRKEVKCKIIDSVKSKLDMAKSADEFTPKEIAVMCAAVSRIIVAFGQAHTVPDEITARLNSKLEKMCV